MLLKIVYNLTGFLLASPMFYFISHSEDQVVWFIALGCLGGYAGYLQFVHEIAWDAGEMGVFFRKTLEAALVVYAVTFVYLLVVKPMLSA